MQPIKKPQKSHFSVSLPIRLQVDTIKVVHLQTVCLRNGINKVGIPDLLIAQHARQHRLRLYTLDRHFTMLSQYAPLNLL